MPMIQRNAKIPRGSYERGKEKEKTAFDLDLNEFDASSKSIESDIESMFMEACQDFDKINIPYEDPSQPQLSPREMMAKLDEMQNRDAGKDERVEQHERVVLLIDGDKSTKEVMEMTRQDHLREGKDKEAQVALVDKDNRIEGKMPASSFLNFASADKLIDVAKSQEDEKNMPEAVYCLIGDTQGKGEYSFADSLADLDSDLSELRRESAELESDRYDNLNRDALEDNLPDKEWDGQPDDFDRYDERDDFDRDRYDDRDDYDDRYDDRDDDDRYAGMSQREKEDAQFWDDPDWERGFD